jgi:pyrroline-5-carboxylate reductase
MAKVRTMGVIGAGVMGQALIKGLMAKGIFQAENIWAAVKTESSAHSVASELGVRAFTDYLPAIADTELLLLCVKPNGLRGVLEKLQTAKLKPGTIVISIVAGQTIAQMESVLGVTETSSAIAVIRAMTNTPCLVGQGMTAITGGTHTTKAQMTVAQTIFEAVGDCIQLDESHFDAVTGLSGSGPAYVYLMMEALVDGGVRVGLPRQAALRIVAQTLLGAATMVQQSKRHPAALRDDVTTPAGCTIGALLVMEDGKIRSTLARAVEEATQIAGGLGQPKA